MAVGPGEVVAISFGIVILLIIAFIAWKHYTKRTHTHIPPTDSIAAAKRMETKATDMDAQPKPIVDTTALSTGAHKAG
tara:strand:+ start:546 stop:779 length:234 start_codon:yes stop_codon:yes gene_type:complete